MNQLACFHRTSLQKRLPGTHRDQGTVPNGTTGYLEERKSGAEN